MKRRTPSARPSASSAPSPAVAEELQKEVEKVEIDWQPIPECLSHCTGYVLHWVSDLGHQVFAGALATLNLIPDQLAILEVLRSEGPMVQSRLSDWLRIDKATMVSLLNGLESQGLVVRTPHPTDRRAFQVQLLAAGQQRVDEAEQVCTVVTNHFFAPLSPDEQQTLHELLRRLAASNAPRIQPEGYP
ncbi:MarR family winged helix-turn-helix transcriptional regulator [Leptolyngbya sp. FACHB-261]|uniref:MarR family winged helix-turn-helix transcriptional regulator n=1 Tax=Leptolyngbya sp. FACHB-261 TaxID=2692806 RepID=UPI0016826501|nr:MarR family transcriptional regulator [Leptolyngbya sp. FACHB-261]MBD2101934.1 MarR family transcriptional regulator [Leptolyngbya sp. FACHB-261]